MHSTAAFAILFALGAVAAPSNKHAHMHNKRDGAVVMKTEVVQETITVAPNGQPIPTGGSSDQNQPQVQGYAPVVNENQGQPVQVQYHQEQSHPQPPVYQAPPPPPAPSSSQAPPPPPPAPASQAASQPAAGYDKQGNQAPKSGTQDYKNAVVLSHNCHRANHSAPAIQYDDTLASAAEKWGKSCQFAHSSTFQAANFPDGYGQNIAAGTNDDDVAAVTSQQWYNWEVMDFSFQGIQNGMPQETGKDTGHFTQVVWKGTTHVGCWTGYCDNMMNGAWYTVCNYGPSGNVMGEYSQHLSPADGSQQYTTGT